MVHRTMVDQFKYALVWVNSYFNLRRLIQSLGFHCLLKSRV